MIGYNWLEPTQVVRNAKRFARKYYLAEMLSAKLFQSEAEFQDMLKNLSATTLWKTDQKLKDVLKKRVPLQQQWVRTSFLCDPHQTPEVMRFIDMVVKPATSVSVSSMPQDLVNVMGRYMSILGGEEASEEDLTNIRIACAALNGDLSRHPLVQGPPGPAFCRHGPWTHHFIEHTCLFASLRFTSVGVAFLGREFWCCVETCAIAVVSLRIVSAGTSPSGQATPWN